MRKIIYVHLLLILIFPNLAYAAGKDDSTMLSWDIHLTPNAEYLDINLVVRNTSDQSIQLEFPTSKLYDFSIMNENNKEVYRFSKGKFYLQAFQYVRLKSGEEKTWNVHWDYRHKGKRLEPGKYTLIATLLPIKVNGKPSSIPITEKKEFVIPSLYNIHIDGESGKYDITGNVGVSNERYFYTVDDGHNLIVDKQMIHWKKDKGTFHISINIPENKLPKNASIILSIYDSHEDPILIKRLKK